ncbi:MAG TPA: Uma2 family endonuclease [Pirellulales bacterium]|nr:Uma2 family endonuclease [Pirellulales bacterium]
MLRPLTPYPETPRLETGDRLDQPTFHRLYEEMPGNFKAELIQGTVIVPSPLRPNHGKTHGLVMGWLMAYHAATPGTDMFDNTTALLPPDDEPQPDAMLIIKPDHGGQTRDEDGYLAGAPELIVEVASSSISYDLHAKYDTYRQEGVREYVVVVLKEREVRWFALELGRFVPLPADEDGIYRSKVFPGLWLDAAALLAGDARQMLDVVERGIATPEHAAFVERLRGPAQA